MASVANPFDVLEPVESRQSRRRKSRRGGGGGGKDGQGAGGLAEGTPTASGSSTGAAATKGYARSGRGHDGSGGAGVVATTAPSSTASVHSVSASVVSPKQQGGAGGDRGEEERDDRGGKQAQAQSGSEEDSDGRWEVVRGESYGKGSSKQGGGSCGAAGIGHVAGALGNNLSSGSGVGVGGGGGGGGGGGSSTPSVTSNAAVVSAGIADGSRSRSEVQLPPVSGEIERIESLALACACAADVENRVQLWREWARRAGEVAPAATKGKETTAIAVPVYALGDSAGASGRITPLTWKEVFLLSKGLEITIEGCFSTPFKPEHQGELEALLCALFPASCEPRALSPLVADIVSLVASEPAKIVNSAKLAVCSTVAALKGATGLKEKLGSENNTPLEVVDAEIAECDQRLTQLGSGGDQVSRLNERARCSWELLHLHKGRLDLVLESRSESTAESLRSIGIKEPKASPTEVLNFIEGLSGAVTEQSLTESAKIQQQQAAAKKGDTGRGRAQAQLADLRKQMADLGNSATEIRGKIRVAEEALVKMRTELSNVEARHAALQEQYRQKAPSGGSGTRGAGANVAPVPCTQVAASLQKHGAQLSAVHALKNFVLRTQKSWGERVSQERQHPGQSMECAVEGYLQALATHLRNKQQQQQEVKQRLRFCLEKMVPLETEMHQLVRLKKTSLANELVKPLQALQKIQKQWLEEEESLMSNINSVAEMLQSAAVTTAIGSSGAQAVHEEMWQRLTTAIHQMRNEHNLITAAASAEISVAPIQAHLPYGCARGVASTEALSALLSGAPGIDFLSNVSGLSTPTSPPTPHTTPVATQGQIVI